jgi:glyoxylase-like metal-dependent hydrolase (beta-lactamase superfamily II)
VPADFTTEHLEQASKQSFCPSRALRTERSRYSISQRFSGADSRAQRALPRPADGSCRRQKNWTPIVYILPRDTGVALAAWYESSGNAFRLQPPSCRLAPAMLRATMGAVSMKQEQESASDEVVEVAPDVLRMQLPIQMPGLGHVNMYCLLDERGAAVVDPGLPGDESWAAIEQRLTRANLRIRDVHTVIVTHSHPDHFGGAGRFHAETGCRVIAHRAFRVFGQPLSVCEPEPSAAELDARLAQRAGEHADEFATRRARAVVKAEQDEHWPERPPRQAAPWGGQAPGPSAEQLKRFEQLRASGRAIPPRITHAVEHDSVIQLARREWFVRFTPGHTADHICLHDPDQGVFLAGDHVLPSITPHISGLSDRPDPLQAFYDSLAEVAVTPKVQRCLPAHGHPFADLAGRAHAIRRHHDERLVRIQEISKRLGPASVQAITQQLFQERNWGSMAESETYAHLEHLRLRKRAECHRDADGLLIYEAG